MKVFERPDYEEKYAKFKVLYQQGKSMDYISLAIDVHKRWLGGPYFKKRLAREIGKDKMFENVDRVEHHNRNKDTINCIMELVHGLESRYGNLANEIPEDDRQLMELREVVHTNH